MTNEEMLLRALLGQTELTEFQPQTNKQAYLAYAVGLIDDSSLLPEPRTNEEVLLYEYCVNGGSGYDGELPTLTNPATAALILAGYEAINGSGRKVTGTMRDNGDMRYELSPNTDIFPIRAGYHSGNGEVTVRTGSLTVTPSAKEQIFEADDVFFDKVTVEPAPEGGGGDGLKVTMEGLTTAYTDNGTASKAKGIFSHWLATKLDLRALDVSGLTDLKYAFYYNTKVQEVDVTGWDFSNMADLNNAFCWASALQKIIGISSWDTSKVTNMQNLFNSASKLESLDLTGWDTGAVTNMSNMFSNCSKLEEIKGLEDLDTKNVKSMYGMFVGTPFKSIDLSKWDTSALAGSLNTMFKDCASLETVDLTGWNFGGVTSMDSTFYGCKSLKEINSTGWDTSQVTSFQSMFHYCTALERFDMSTWGTAKATSFASMFNGCKELQEIIGFSATNKAGLTIGFPVGNATMPSGLKRLTFRTDLPEGTYAIRSAINITYSAMERSGAVEMFNSLPDVSALGLNSTYTKITLTGNPCVASTVKLPEKSGIAVSSYAEFAALADEFYGGYDRTGAQIKGFVDGVGWELVDANNVNEDFFNYSQVSFLEFTATVPDSMKLTDEDRAIATGKGWTLVE